MMSTCILTKPSHPVQIDLQSPHSTPTRANGFFKPRYRRSPAFTESGEARCFACGTKE